MCKIDLNCDMGESFGAYVVGNDEDILDMITSTNIACGYHAGDHTIMRKTVTMALQKNVAVGAHPGLPDLSGFGRRKMDITVQEAYDMVVYQIGALNGFIQALGGKMQHVKVHGALYNMAAVNSKLAEAIAEAVYQVNAELILVGLSDSELVRAGEKLGMRTASEVFADRTYHQNGTLTSRREPGAMIQKAEDAATQVIRMVKEGKVMSQQAIDIPIKADTVCIHGDGPHALEFTRYIRSALDVEGIALRAMGSPS